MKTRAGVINTSNKSNEKPKRKPLGDKTNNVNSLANVQRKNKNSAVQERTVKTRQNTKDVANNLEINKPKTRRNVQPATESKPDPKNKSANTTTNTQSRSSSSKTDPKPTNSDENKSKNALKLDAKRRSSRVSTSKTEDNDLKPTETKNLDESNNLKSEASSRTSTESNEIIKSKRLLVSLKNVSSEKNQSDPYEFKFDPKDEPKRNPKRRRGRPKKSDSSDEDKSMKPIIKNMRKKQNIPLTPVERNLRNRVVKNPFKEMIVVADNSEIQTRKKSSIKVDNVADNSEIQIQKKPSIKVDKKIPQIVKVDRKNPQTKESEIKTVEVDKIPQTNEIKTLKVDEKQLQTNEIVVCDKNIESEILDVTHKNDVKNVSSVVDEINEIANTFMEEDLFDDNSEALISSPSRIDIISELIARRRNKPKVFNSTMVQETPQIEPKSPWRIELSVIPKKPLNFSVKNTSFTPSYTPDITYSNKKQSTLLDFVKRQPKPDLPITLFQNSPTRKPFANLSNSISPIKTYAPAISPTKRSNDSLFGFTFLSDSEENKENSPGPKTPRKNKKSPKKQTTISSPKKQTTTSSPKKQSPIKTNEVVIDEPPDISIPLFEDLHDTKHKEKRYSRQYTRPQTKRKRNVSYTIDSDSESDEEVHHPIKKKQKDVVSKEEAEEADRLASHYNSLFDEIENYPLCIE